MKIMLAYDGSRNAKLALARTITMFKDIKPHLVLVSVAENPRDITERNEEFFGDLIDEAEKFLAEAQSLCQNEGVSVETVLLEGDARKMLLAATEKLRPDMLVVARRSQEPDGGFIARSLNYFVDELDYMTFGSVSAFLTRRAQCPLLILPS